LASNSDPNTGWQIGAPEKNGVISAPMLCLFFIPAAILVVGAIGFGLRQHDQRAASNGPVCGKCGYCVRGLPTFICPECGSDVRDVGIIVPGTKTFGPILRGVIWTAAFALVAVATTIFIISDLDPVIHSCQQNEALLAPRSNLYQRVDFHAYGSRVQWPFSQPPLAVTPQNVDVTLTPNAGNSIVLHVTGYRMGYDYVNAAGKTVRQASGLNADAVRDWMKSAKIDTSSGEVLAEARDIVQFVQDATSPSPAATFADTFGGYSTGGSWTGSAPWQPAFPIACLFWLVVWIIGLRKVTRTPAGNRDALKSV